MEDILGRELKDGDLCIGMAISRHSSGMQIGIIKGKSLVQLWNNRLSRSSMQNLYLIENPVEKELKIKEEIEKLLIQEEQERERRTSLKTIPLNKLEVGGIYKNTNDDYYLYLGKRKVILEEKRWDKFEVKNEKEGHCFAPVWEKIIKEMADEEILNDAIDPCLSHHISVIKGNKKLTELVKKIKVEFPLITSTLIKSIRNYYGKEIRLTIE